MIDDANRGLDCAEGICPAALENQQLRNVLARLVAWADAGNSIDAEVYFAAKAAAFDERQKP